METLGVIALLAIFMAAALVSFRVLISFVNDCNSEIIEIPIQKGYKHRDPIYRPANSSGSMECVITFDKEME
jgi:hypothetical protein